MHPCVEVITAAGFRCGGTRFAADEPCDVVVVLVAGSWRPTSGFVLVLVLVVGGVVVMGIGVFFWLR